MRAPSARARWARGGRGLTSRAPRRRDAPTRLRSWCVVELFCYTQMGGTQVEMQMLEGFDEATLRRFDARGCKCFQAEDYEKM